MIHLTSIEYVCIDCGETIVAIGLDAKPADSLCVTCRWLGEMVSDPVIRERLRSLRERMSSRVMKGEKDDPA